ncbi:MAG: uracil-xanthine permease [Clostridia bacterium]|nr:uracil-xanthine permease [Clostridia bacterium]
MQRRILMENNGIRDARSLGMPKMLVLGLQHMFAMFGATVLVPALTGLSVSATLLFAGLGTLLFHFLTKGRVPAFLGSSFAFLAGYAAIAPNGEAELLPYACVGVACSAILYLVLAGLVKAFGTRKVMSFFPPIVTGPIIICIGMTLANSAINNCTGHWGIALVAIVTVIAFNIWGKGMFKIVPILMGVLVSYALAAVLGQVDFSGVAEASWIGLPVAFENTVFSLFGKADGSLLLSAVIAIMPIALATMIEHIGDICAISSTVGENFIEEPGLHRTLMGDGFATALASLFGAPANTTYGENTGVLALTKVYDPAVIRLAAVFAIIASFCPKFSALVSAMPVGTIGGVSLILYGMISAIGVRNLVENKVDLTASRNVIIASLIMSLALGITFSAAGAIKIAVFGVSLNFSGLAVAAVVGIVANAILPGKDYEFSNSYASGKPRSKHD